MRSRTVFVLAALVSVSTGALAQRSATSPPRKIVFVCEHGTVKSVVALEYFNRLAHQRGLEYEAVSRGTKPDSALPSPVRAGLTSDGFDLTHFTPTPFTSSDLRSAALVVAFDADVDPVVNGRLPVIRWDSTPSVVSNYEHGRAEIRSRVERLVDSLARSTKPARPR